MGKIKHIAIASQDPDKTAKFYEDPRVLAG